MELKSLGLSNYESRVYECLVKFGKSSAGKISKESGVSYGRIYEVLGSLENKGLVKTLPDKTKMFIPTNPKYLIGLVEKKEKEFSTIRKEVDKLKQLYEIHEEEVVKVVQGRKNFYKMINGKDEPKTFKYSIKYSSEIKPELLRKDKLFIKKGVDVKSLNRYGEETKKDVNKWLKVNKNIKQIKNEGVALSVVDSEVVIGLINNNTTISIKDKAFIGLMKDLFSAKYKLSKNILN